MVCRPHSSTGGQLLQLWLGISSSFFFFFKSFPEFTPRLTTCGDEVITVDSFSPSKISPGLRCLILLLYPKHIKNSPPSNGIICMKGNCPTSYLQFCHSIFSQGRAEEGGRKERTHLWKKRREIFISAAEANIPPACSCPLFLLLKVRLLFSPSSVIFLGAFQKLHVDVGY